MSENYDPAAGGQAGTRCGSLENRSTKYWKRRDDLTSPAI